MMEISVVYVIVAYLTCWLIDLIVIVVRSPSIQLDPVLKLIVVALCLFMVLFALQRHHWLWGA